jgi:hypothetical protein
MLPTFDPNSNKAKADNRCTIETKWWTTASATELRPTHTVSFLLGGTVLSLALIYPMIATASIPLAVGTLLAGMVDALAWSSVPRVLEDFPVVSLLPQKIRRWMPLCGSVAGHSTLLTACLVQGRESGLHDIGLVCVWTLLFYASAFVFVCVLGWPYRTQPVWMASIVLSVSTGTCVVLADIW